MIKKVIGLVLFLLVANAGFRVAIVWFHNQQFEDAVREIALFGAGKSDDTLKNSVMGAASDNQVPLDPDFVDISRRNVVGTADHVIIKYSYAVMVPVIPGKPRRFDFSYITP